MDNQNIETKKCKYCQVDIPKKAKICPNCKKKQSHNVMWIIIGIVVLFIFVDNYKFKVFDNYAANIFIFRWR